MKKNDADRYRLIPVQRGWTLRVEDKMGVVTERLLAVVTSSVRLGGDAGIQLQTFEILEDFHAFERLVMGFPATPVNGLQGYFLLSLQPRHHDTLWVRQAVLRHGVDRTFARVQMKSGAQIEARWAYSRQPEMQMVAFAAFDDPTNVIEASCLRRSEFPDSLQASYQLSGTAEWAWHDVEISPAVIRASEGLDKCELLLEHMDRNFRKESADSLHWNAELVTKDRLEAVAVASEMEATNGRGRLNVVLEYGGRELVMGKRILPIVRYPVTLIGPDGRRTPATVGCSVAK